MSKGKNYIRGEKMKITTLIENKLGVNEELEIEHGISLYIEVNGKKILFDTGQGEKFLRNAKKLNVDLKDLDYVIVSHGHHDHSGGLPHLIKEINPDVKIYVGREFFNKKHSLRINGSYDFVGNPFDESFFKENNLDVEYIDNDITSVTDSLSIYTNFKRNREFNNINETMFISDGDGFVKDEFRDEISLGIKTDKGLVVLVGCSHAGIINILKTIKERGKGRIYAVVGGTHLIREDDTKINKIIDYLKEENIKVIGACHCTGKQGETMLTQQLEENFIKNNTGDKLEF